MGAGFGGKGGGPLVQAAQPPWVTKAMQGAEEQQYHAMLNARSQQAAQEQLARMMNARSEIGAVVRVSSVPRVERRRCEGCGAPRRGGDCEYCGGRDG